MTLEWLIGTSFDYCFQDDFISRVWSSVVSLLKGKRPKTEPLRWSSTIETGSHQMSLLLSGIWVTSVTSEWVGWNLIDILSQYWHDLSWILFQWQIIGLSDTRVVNWHFIWLLLTGRFHLKGPVFGRFPFKRETTEDRALEMNLLLRGIWVTSLTSEWVQWNLIYRLALN